MRTTLTLLAAAFLAAGPLPAQSSTDLLQIEVAAARRALSSGNAARHMIAVDSMYAIDGTAPGKPGSTARPAARTQALHEAIMVPAAANRLTGTVLLLLTEPRISGNSARVTTTTLRADQRGRTTHETLTMTLRRGPGGWEVTAVNSER